MTIQDWSLNLWKFEPLARRKKNESLVNLSDFAPSRKISATAHVA